MAIEISLAGKRALITGASRGLGQVIARTLDEAGASLVLHYGSNRTAAEALAGTLSSPPLLIQADLGKPAEVEALFKQAAQAGPVTILVNCAAAESQDISMLNEMTEGRWNNTMNVNVTAPMILTRLFAAQGVPGSVVNISSIEGSIPAMAHGHYSTSKAALEMLTRSSALEFGGNSVRVNAIAPGLIHREGIEKGWPEGVEAWRSSAPLGDLVRSGDVASAVAFLASDLSASTTGSVLTIDAGLSTKSGW